MPARLGAQFILKTRDGRKLTQVATNGIIIQDTTVIIESTVQTIERRIIDSIENFGIAMSDDQLAELKAVFSDEKLTNPFHGLETEYQQETFIQENFDYVVCIII